MQILYCLLFIIVAGVLSHIIGEALPRSWFSAAAWPYAPWSFEKSGRLYRALQVRRWKDKLPDKSKIVPGMVRKSVSPTATSAQAERLVAETCVAELVHVVLMLLSGVIYLLCPNAWGAAIAIVYGLSHIPFIIIQRFNRPTLALLAQRLKQREEKIRNAHPDSLGQHR